jgi:hypothetical protein
VELLRSNDDDLDGWMDLFVEAMSSTVWRTVGRSKSLVVVVGRGESLVFE